MPWMVLGSGLGVSPMSNLGPPGETIEGEQRPEKLSHSLTLPHKGGLADII